MDWDFDDDDFAPEPQARAERQLLPEGHYDLTIHKVVSTDEQLELVLVHPDKAYGWVFAKFPKGRAWSKAIVRSLKEALGLDRDAWRKLQPEDLVDRKVRARLYHKSGKDGSRVFVNVGEFHAVEPDDGPPPEEPKRSRNAVPVAEAADDIPF